MNNQVSDNPVEKNRHLPPLVILSGLMITCYLTAEVMSVKQLALWGVTWFDAGTIIFPATYMLSDVLTEVWGFRTMRRVIWLAFCCMLIFVGMAWLGVWLPYPSETESIAAAYKTVYSFVPRIVGASLLAFLLGELLNAWLMERIKVWTQGRHLWLRSVGSSALGYIVDTTVFVWVAFGGVLPVKDLWSMIFIQVPFKLLITFLLATPAVYVLVRKVRKSLQNA